MYPAIIIFPTNVMAVFLFLNFFFKLWYFHEEQIKYMNIIIYTLVIFGIIYFLLKLFANTASKKISKHLRKLIFIGSIILAILLAVGGKFLLSIPLTITKFGHSKAKRAFSHSINWII